MVAIVTKPASRRAFLRAVGHGALGAVGSAGAVGVLAACGIGGDTAPPPPAARRDVTLYFQNWTEISRFPETVGAWHQAAFDAFTQQYPGAKVEYVVTAFAQIVEKTIATVAAGTPPDVTVASILMGRELFDKSALRPLDDLLRKAPDLAPAKYIDVANFYRRSQGKHFGLPIYTDSSLLAVNSRLLRDAGLDPKAADLATWDDLVRYSERLTKRDGGKITQLGFPFGRPNLEELASFVYGNGVELHDAEVSKATFNTGASAQRMAEVLRYRATNYQRFATNWAEDMTADPFKIGKSAIRYANIGFHSLVNAGTYVPKDFEFWLVPIPKGPAGAQVGGTTWVNMVAQPTGGKEPELAFELSRAFAGPTGQGNMFRFDASPAPSFKDFYQSKEWTDRVKQDPVLGVIAKVVTTGKTYPFFRRYNDINRDVTPLLGDAIEGKLDHRQALAEAERKASAILSA